MENNIKEEELFDFERDYQNATIYRQMVKYLKEEEAPLHEFMINNHLELYTEDLKTIAVNALKYGYTLFEGLDRSKENEKFLTNDMLANKEIVRDEQYKALELKLNEYRNQFIK